MLDKDGFKRKSTRIAAIKAAKRIKKYAKDNAHNYPVYQVETIIESDIETSDNKTQRQRVRKQKSEDQVFDSSEPHMMRDLSKNISECLSPPKDDNMPKKRQGRPAKPNPEKCLSTCHNNAKYKDARCKKEDDYADNQRRESYNSFLLNSEPIVPTLFSGKKKLDVGDGGISYRESLMSFTKGLGPIVQKVACRMLQGQGPFSQAPHQLESLFQSPKQDALSHPHLVDLNSINNSVQTTITNQVNQPLTGFGDSNANMIANYKEKTIMVDDGISDRDKWSVAEKLEFLFGKQKGGVKIGKSSLDNKDFGNKNFEYVQVGNQRTVKEISSFCSNYNVNLNQNTSKVHGIELISGQKEISSNASKGIRNASVYPLTNMPLSLNISSTSLGFNGDVNSFSWVPQPPIHTPPSVHPPQNWCLPLLETTTNSVLNDNLWKAQEYQRALALNNHMKDKESNVWSPNLCAPSKTNLFLQSHGQVTHQPQDRLLNQISPNLWSHMALSAAKTKPHPLPFGTQLNSGFQKRNHLQHPPPSI